MFVRNRWVCLIAATLSLAIAATTVADDVFVKEGVVVKPLSKRKQRKLERKLTRRPGNEVVIEGSPTVIPSPDALAGTKARRSLRPLFPDRFGKRPDVVVSPSVITGPSTVVTSPRIKTAPGDPLVLPGSAELMPTPRGVRSPVVSTPRGTTTLPLEPDDEPALEAERPASVRILPPPADEIPAPVVSTPREPAAPAPMPMPSIPANPTPAPAPSVDPGPTPTPPLAPEAAPTAEPTLERPLAPKPA